MSEPQRSRRRMSNAELLSFAACGVNPYDADPVERIDAHDQPAREAAFFRRQRARARHSTPAGQPVDWDASAARHAAYVADLIATFCPHGVRCAALCPEGKAAANVAINAEWCRDNPDPKFARPSEPYHWGLTDVRVVERDSPEGQALLRQRAERDPARAKADGRDVDAGLVAALVSS